MAPRHKELRLGNLLELLGSLLLLGHHRGSLLLQPAELLGSLLVLQVLRDNLHLPGELLGSLHLQGEHLGSLLEEPLLHQGSLLEVHLVWGMTCSLKLQNIIYVALFPQH